MTTNPWKVLPKFEKNNNVSFPKLKIRDINGIKLYYFQDNSIELAGFRMFFDCGSTNESKIGLAEIVADLMTKSTKTKSPEEIYQFTDSLGCDLDCSVSHDFTTFTYSGLSKYLTDGINLLSEMFFSPNITKEELDRTLIQLKSDLEFGYSNPSTVAHIVSSKILFGGHRYQFGTSSQHTDLDTISVEDCEKYYNNTLFQSEYSLICVGNFDEDELFKLIESKFTQNKFTKSNLEPKNIFNFTQCNSIVDFPLNQQTNIKFGMPTININNPDFLPLSVANTLFGGYFLSRLNQNLREEKGLTYGINSVIQRYKLASVFFISSSISSENTKLGVDEILNEMTIMLTDKAKEEEIERSRQYLLGTSLRLFESSLSLISSTTNLLISNLDINFYEQRYQRLQELSNEEVYSAQKKYFKPENYVLTMIGDSEKLSSEFGKDNVVFYDKFGNKLA